MSSPAARVLVVGGAGQVGGMVVDLALGWGAEVTVVEPGPAGLVAPGASVHRGDVTAITPRLAAVVGRADTVVLAVPETTALAGLDAVLAAMRPGALLVDTLSVKARVVRVLRERAGHVEAVSVNPMFAPALGMAGRPVAAVVVHGGPRSQAFLERIEGQGARVVRLGADEHDRLAAAAQALPHAAVLAFGLALSELGVDMSDLAAVAPPPQTTLLALLARIASGSWETYWDVQSANPHAAAARTALTSAVNQLAGIAEHDRRGDFLGVIDQTRALLGTQHEHYRDVCAEVFHALDRANDHPTPFLQYRKGSAS